jgi:hypothetical protein
MVVLAAGMTTKNATLFSRQFVDMPRMRVEGLFNSFPKLLDKSSQHTFIETESVRYLFQPVESLYIVVIATKNSNMMEDLETMKLLSRCVPECCGLDTPTEEKIMSCVFELIFAFDEVISPHGYKENLTIAAVKTALEMDSNEERIAIALRRQKEAEAAEETKRRQADITRQRKEREAMQRRGGGAPGGGMGSMGGGGGGGGGSIGGDQSHYDTPVIQKTAPAPAPAPRAARGMKLGKKPEKNNDELMQQMMAEGGMSSGRPAAKAGPAAPTTGVVIELKEVVDIELNKDGGLEMMEVKGELQLEVSEDDSAQLKIEVDLGDNEGFQFRTHPNIDKQQYANEGVLGLKNPERPFPISSALGVLKWRMTSKDDGALPISINCWPSQSGDLSYVNIEYELVQSKFELTDVVIAIPVPGSVDSINVEQIDGEYKVDRRSEMLHWTLDMIDASNSSGSFEFTTPVCAGDSFFPVELSFVSSKTFIDMTVAGVNHAVSGQPLRNNFSSQLSVGRYTVG